MAPGTVAHLKIMRDGKSRDIDVKLGELPESAMKSAASEQEADGPLAGMKVEDLTPEIAKEFKLPVDIKGVVVDSVEPGSAAADAGLRRGDVIEKVNRQPVTNASEYQHAVQEAGKQPIMLLVNRDGMTSFVVVQSQ